MTGRAIVWIKRSQGRTHFLIPSSSRPTQSHVGVDPPPLSIDPNMRDYPEAAVCTLLLPFQNFQTHILGSQILLLCPPHQAAARVHALPEIATCDQSFCSVSTYTQCPLPLSSQYLCLGLAGGGEPLLLLLLLQRRHSKQPKPWSRQTSEPRRRTFGGLRRRRGHFTGRVPP